MVYKIHPVFCELTALFMFQSEGSSGSSLLEAATKLQNDEILKAADNCSNTNVKVSLRLPDISQYDSVLKRTDYHRCCITLIKLIVSSISPD